MMPPFRELDRISSILGSFFSKVASKHRAIIARRLTNGGIIAGHACVGMADMCCAARQGS